MNTNDRINALVEENARLKERLSVAENERDALAIMADKMFCTLKDSDDINSDWVDNEFNLDKAEMDLSARLLGAKRKALADYLTESKIPRKAKSGCIGEFEIQFEQCCPECWQEQSDDCHMCNGQSDENGIGTTSKPIPWDTQKEIWKRMNRFALEELQASVNDSDEVAA